jgi:hypothetical protein
MNWKLTIMGLALATAIAAMSQVTNRNSQTDYSAFRIIGERNIFNQHRQHREKGQSKSTTTGDRFSLVGTMSYEKGDFAFFDGTSSEYRKILQIDGTIAGHKVTQITPLSVKLKIDMQEVEMKVGSQMRRDDEGAWQPSAVGELPPVPFTPAAGIATNPAESGPSNSDSNGEANDVLKKLMQKREQEMK